jgi:hypothetical protein
MSFHWGFRTAVTADAHFLPLIYSFVIHNNSAISMNGACVTVKKQKAQVKFLSFWGHPKMISWPLSFALALFVRR